MINLRQTTAAALTSLMIGASCTGIAVSAPSHDCYFDSCKTNGANPTASSAGTSRQNSVLSEHGSWIAVTDGKMTIFMDRFDGGAKFAIADMGDHFGLLMSDPNWHLTKGEEYKLTIRVDGEVYTDKVVAFDETTLILERTTKDFVRALYNGEKAKISVASDSYEMTLANATATIDDVKLKHKASTR